MRGFIGLTSKEKEDILKKHSQVYDGYATKNNTSNMYPLTVYNDARDSQGITLDNKYNPSGYKNFKINEIAAKNLHYSEIDPAYEFDSNGPGDPNLGYDIYNDTKTAYDFDSKGPSDPYYGGGYQTGEEKSVSNKEEFNIVNFEDYLDNYDKNFLDDENLSDLDKIDEIFKRF